jgi:ribA/ribD-fused uncharacterized protein
VVTLDGVEYRSVEHAYQAAKVLDPKRRQVLTLAFNPTLTATKAKKIGRNFTNLRDGWDEIKYNIMAELLVQKFSDPKMRRVLEASGKAELIEGNWWHDTYWGVCYGGLKDGFHGRTCEKWPHEPDGQNMLGKLLMQIRDIPGLGFYHWEPNVNSAAHEASSPIELSNWKCQFCLEESPSIIWGKAEDVRGDMADACPKCGKAYDWMLAQDSEE